MMKNPPHPGGVLRRQVIAPLGLTVTAAAKALDVSRPALSNLLNERVALSAEMAIRFEKAFGADMETLLGLQYAFDVATARKAANAISIGRYSAPAGGRLGKPRRAA
jgi:antitoxin HigA-1